MRRTVARCVIIWGLVSVFTIPIGAAAYAGDDVPIRPCQEGEKGIVIGVGIGGIEKEVRACIGRASP